jgi:probable addiction module antidote protein
MKNDVLTSLGITEFDAANELNSLEEIADFLQACMEEAPEDAAFIAHALGVVARAKTRMASIAGESGLSRESLYKALSGRRDPSFSTVLKVVAALGLRLQFAPDEKQASAPEANVVHRQTANSAAQQPTQPVEFCWSDPQPRLDQSIYVVSVKTKSVELESTMGTRGSGNYVGLIPFGADIDWRKAMKPSRVRPSSEAKTLGDEASARVH